MSMTTQSAVNETQPSRKGRSRGLIALLIVLLIASGGSAWYFTNRPTPAAAAQADGSVPLQKNLTVSLTDMLPSAAQCDGGDTFVRNSLDAPQRRWTDSVSTPFKASAKDSMLKELMAEHCVNPTLLTSTIKGMSAITINGWNVGDHNPWMSQFMAQANDSGLRSAFLTKKEDTGNKIFVTTELDGGYQHYAALTNALLLKVKNAGVVTQLSLTNYHLPGGGLVAGELVMPTLNKHQENLPALRLEVTEKGRSCVYAFGFNTGDKRFESFACKVKTKKPQTTTPPSGCKSNCGTPPATRCKSNCGGRDDSKDWSLSVDPHQGVTPLGPGKKTDGKESERQKESGQTSGNVTDNPVDPDTRSGDTTSDTGTGVPAGGATQGGGNSGPVVTDDGNNHDDGGTSGDGEIPPPPD